MKRIEDIERMSAQQLEAEAIKQELNVPEGLRSELELALAAQMTQHSERKRKARRRGFAATAGCLAAAACLAVAGAFLLRTPALSDTFSDPHQAYTQVQMSFNLMSEKLSPGINRIKTEKQIFTDTTNKLIKQ